MAYIGFCCQGYLVLYNLIANCTEKIYFLRFRSNQYFDYEVTYKGLETKLNSTLWQDPKQFYSSISKQDSLKASKITNLVGIVTISKPIWSLKYIDTNKIFKPYLLHKIYIGLLYHILNSVIVFVKKYKRIRVFNIAWKNIFQYPNFKKSD